ncbi:hypothetical protein GOV13_00300 [Candidatus Pacearchaeota archaeon]|nr:hypothetical protein [Candidatus Pacearchaeota archaeon]
MVNKMEKILGKTLVKGLEIAGVYVQYGIACLGLANDGFLNGYTNEWEKKVKKHKKDFTDAKDKYIQ